MQNFRLSLILPHEAPFREIGKLTSKDLDDNHILLVAATSREEGISRNDYDMIRTSKK
jgi:hypothetical protein